LALAELPDRRHGERSTHSGRKRVVLAFFALLMVGGLAWAWRVRSLARGADHRQSDSKSGVDPSYSLYVGERVCSECHPGEAALHRRSGHAKTLRSVAQIGWERQLDGAVTEDPERPGVFWKFTKQDGQYWTERTGAGAVERFVIDYAFGSGRHAITFVSLVDRDPLRPVCREHRLSFFAHTQSAGLTPGLSLAGHAAGNSESGCVHSTAETQNCFRCHTTVTSDRGSGVLDPGMMIPNISCERCHGPARSHVEAARRGDDVKSLRMPFGQGRYTTNDQLELCGRCHRLPAMITRGAIRTDNPSLIRHQPVGLIQSACFEQSNRAINCVTCHDPHARASSDRTHYETICLSCHGAKEGVSCSVSPRSGCIECHMPRREATRGMMMTDHWIRIIPGLRIDPGQDKPSESSRTEPGD
jgi:Cytochrome c554 and c-prime